MSNQQRNQLLSFVAITVILLLSFRSYAAHLSPSFSSDNAIHVLMAYHLQLPEDLYFWGQDRLGSLVPIASHLVLSLIPAQPIQVVAYTHYFFLIVGFLCFALLLRSNISRVIFALVWFLPLQPLEELIKISHPYGVQYAFIGLALVLFDRVPPATENGIKRRILIALAVLCLFVSLWVSDFTIVPMFLVALLGLWHLYQQMTLSPLNPREKLLRSFGADFLAVLLSTGAGMLFLLYAKAHADQRRSYGLFNTVAQTLEVIARLATSLFRTLTFRAENVFLSLHAIAAVVLCVAIAFILWRGRKTLSLSQPRWLYLCLGTLILGTLLLLLSNWVYRNQINLRYFASVYVPAWLAALFFAESLRGRTAAGLFALLLTTALFSSLSLPDHVFALQKQPPRLQELQQLASVGRAGFIGEFQTAYVACAAAPELLDCTPYDQKGGVPCLAPPSLQRQVGRVRCKRCIADVMSADTIYLIQERWLEQFPPEIQQFRQCLTRVGEPRPLGGFTIAPYQKTADGRRLPS